MERTTRNGKRSERRQTLDGSGEIISMLTRISSKLDMIESELDGVSDRMCEIANAVSALETQAAVTAEDLAAIRSDINDLEPGII